MNKAIIIVVVTITLIGVGAAISRTQYLKESFTVTNFDQCVAAGNPVMESYPAQCQAEDGRIFAEDLPPRLSAQRTCATVNIPADVSLDTFLDRANGSVEVRWRDHAIGDETVLLLPYDPTNDFPGCSESAKRVLRHVEETDRE